MLVLPAVVHRVMLVVLVLLLRRHAERGTRRWLVLRGCLVVLWLRLLRRRLRLRLVRRLLLLLLLLRRCLLSRCRRNASRHGRRTEARRCTRWRDRARRRTEP